MVHQRRLPGAAGDVLHHPAAVAAQELRYVGFGPGVFVNDRVTKLPARQKKTHVCAVAPPPSPQVILVTQADSLCSAWSSS